MPCGGIWPLSMDNELFKSVHSPGELGECFYCGNEIKPADLMWCEEWDCYLHRDCVWLFLQTEEGKVVLAHGHQVILYFSQEEETEDAKSE